MRIGYLGPRGTITEEALLKYLRVKEEKTVPYLTVYDVVRAVERREVEKGLVPIENSIEGSVNVTLDLLAFETDLFIEKEIVAPVSHNLLGKKGVKLQSEEVDFQSSGSSAVWPLFEGKASSCGSRTGFKHS